MVVFLSATVLFVPLFRWLKLGAIIGYLAAGIIIGPFGLEFITDVKTLFTFSELGVVFLLFVIGLELNPSRLWKMRYQVFGYGSVQILLTSALLYFPLKWFGLETTTAIVVALGLALSSTAFAIQLLREKKQLQTDHGQTAFSILLFQDISVVPILALVAFLAPSSSEAEMTLLDGVMAISVLLGLIILGRYMFRPLFRFIAETRTQEVFTAAVLLLVIGVALLMEHVGLSMALGAFIAGVILANSEYRHEIEINIEPFKGLLLGLFFMTVGMALNFDALIDKPHLVGLTLLLILTIKSVAIFATTKIFRLSTETSRNVAATLFQSGEFAFVLFAAASAKGLLSSEWNAIFSAGVTLSMVLTPLIFALNAKYFRTYSEVSERPFDPVHEEAKVIIAGFGRYGQIVARLLTLNNISFTALEHNAKQVDTARRFGTKIYYGDARRREVVQSAHGETAELFILAIDDVEASIETAKMVKEHFPHLKIHARVRNREHALELYDLGIKNVCRETYESSLITARNVLGDLGFSQDKTGQVIAKFREHDLKLLKDQLAVKGDETGLISMNSKYNRNLETILREDSLIN